MLLRRIAAYESAKSVNRSRVLDTRKCVLNFIDLQRAADALGEITIGVCRAEQEGKPGGDVPLSPRRDEHLWLNEDDEVVVLTTFR